MRFQGFPAENLHGRHLVRNFNSLIVVVQDSGEFPEKIRIFPDFGNIKITVFDSILVEKLKCQGHGLIAGGVQLVVKVIVKQEDRTKMGIAFFLAGAFSSGIVPGTEIIVAGKFLDLLPEFLRKLRRIPKRHGYRCCRAAHAFCQIIQISYFFDFSHVGILPSACVLL